MILFPAIDLQNGACVRLAQGDFTAATLYEPDPVKQAQAFEAAGAKWLHVVDLDGAREGAVRQLPIIEAIASKTRLSVQVGGGVRGQADIDALLAAGAARVVIGSLAVKEPETVRGWLKQYGGSHLVLALDVRLSTSGLPEVMTSGWQEGSSQALWGLIDLYRDSGLATVLCTDVSRDGMMTGANQALYSRLRQSWGALQVLASGGVHNLDDLLALKELGLAGAIVGKALYEGAIDLKAALAALSDERNG